jgi:outer membrane protein
MTPAWQGSKDMTLVLFPDIRLNYGDTLFASVPDGIGWNAVNQGGWKAGPVVKLRFSRDEERGGSPFLIAGGSDALLGMGNVPATVEAGGFVEAQFGERRQWRARGEVRQGIGGHEALIADVSFAYRGRSGRTAFTLGPRATFVTAPFTRAYFGIDAAQSLRTGLQAYAPSGGLLSAGLSGSAVRPLDRNSALTLFAGVDRLAGQAGRSPLIRERGTRNQFTIGLGYGYRFNL